MLDKAWHTITVCWGRMKEAERASASWREATQKDLDALSAVEKREVRDETVRQFLVMFRDRYGSRANANNVAGFLDVSPSTARRILARLSADSASDN